MSMIGTLRAVGGGRAAIALAFAAIACLVPASAGAATTAYPAGGGFASDAEGWSPVAGSCTLPVLCEAESVYDPGVGNPPGSISARTTVTLNLLGLFAGTSGWNSPEFTVPQAEITGATLALDRAFSVGVLIGLLPSAKYTAVLRDVSTGSIVATLAEDLGPADAAFARKSVAANVVGTHAYRIEIVATTSLSALELSALTGATDVRFDNVALTVESADKPGGGGGADGGGAGAGGGGSTATQTFTSQQIQAIAKGSLGGNATLNGNRLRARVACPARFGRACVIVSRGFLRRGKAATGKTRSRIGKGKAKNIVLRVKPHMRKRLAKKSRVLMRYQVKVGPKKATFYASRKLIAR